MARGANSIKHATSISVVLLASIFAFPLPAGAQAGRLAAKPAGSPAKLRLVGVLVVDQMRADYIAKFPAQWPRGLKRPVAGGPEVRAPDRPHPPPRGPARPPTT